MSRFFQKDLTPYVPGEQPENMEKLIKLNTNESPFPPSKKGMNYMAQHTRSLNLYPDPEQRELTAALAQELHVAPENLILTNGSDEILNFAFMAFCGPDRPAAFPDITYGFYRVFAALHGVPYEEIPLCEDFHIDIGDYLGLGRTIFIANPNAPTGLLLRVEEIDEIVSANPDRVVVIDEAYIDFGGESCVPLIREHDNLLVTRTFSKAYGMAGARLGYGIACESLIRDLKTIKDSTNPYNVNSMTAALAMGTLAQMSYHRDNCRQIAKTRTYLTKMLRRRGFEVLPSMANFVFAASPDIGGEALYLALKEKGVLVRHFDQPRIRDYNRITISTQSQLDKMLHVLDQIMEGMK